MFQDMPDRDNNLVHQRDKGSLTAPAGGDAPVVHAVIGVLAADRGHCCRAENLVTPSLTMARDLTFHPVRMVVTSALIMSHLQERQPKTSTI